MLKHGFGKSRGSSHPYAGRLMGGLAEHRKSILFCLLCIRVPTEAGSYRSFGTGAPQKHQQDQEQLKEYYSVLLLLQRLLVLLLLLFLQVLLLSQVLLLPHIYFNRSFYRTEDPD